MQQDEQKVKGASRTIAPLTNVSELSGVIAKAVASPPHLPKMIGFFGKAGLGKSYAAAYCTI